MAQRDSVGPRRLPQRGLVVLVHLVLLLPTAYSTTTTSQCGEQTNIPEGCMNTAGLPSNYSPPSELQKTTIPKPDQPCNNSLNGGRYTFDFYFYPHGNYRLRANVSFQPHINGRKYYLRSKIQWKDYNDIMYDAIDLDIASGSTLLQMYQVSSSYRNLSLTLFDSSGCVLENYQRVLPQTCFAATKNCSRCTPPKHLTDSELNATADRVISEGRESLWVRWWWARGRSYDGEIFHLKIEEDEGEVRWLKVSGQMEALIKNISWNSGYRINISRYECGCVNNKTFRVEPNTIRSTATASLPCLTIIPNTSLATSTPSPSTSLPSTPPPATPPLSTPPLSTPPLSTPPPSTSSLTTPPPSTPPPSTSSLSAPPLSTTPPSTSSLSAPPLSTTPPSTSSLSAPPPSTGSTASTPDNVNSTASISLQSSIYSPTGRKTLVIAFTSITAIVITIATIVAIIIYTIRVLKNQPSKSTEKEKEVVEKGVRERGYSNPSSDCTDASEHTITIDTEPDEELGLEPGLEPGPNSDTVPGTVPGTESGLKSVMPSSPKPPEPNSTALVLYSICTPSEEVRRIHELLVCGLRQCNNILVDTPDTVSPQEVRKEWIEREMRRRNAVLLVCNKEFYEEWHSESDEGELRIGSIVKVMVGSLSDSELRKVKCVYLREEDRTFSNPTLQLRDPFSLTDLNQLMRIARFVRNNALYAPVINYPHPLVANSPVYHPSVTITPF